MALVTLTQAQQHLRLSVGADSPLSDRDQDLSDKIEQASQLVITYLKRPNHGWTVETDPASDADFALVQAAILNVTANLWSHRGDDEQVFSGQELGPISPRVKQLLGMLRDPAMA